jgi:RNA polymerase sigma-70 factor (ECF subfamily)
MDEAALAQLYEKHAPAIYAHCRRLLHAPAAARDATQEAFVRVLARGPTALAGEDALRYLYRVSTNVCLNQLREQRVHERAAPALLARSAAGQSTESGHADRQFAARILDLTDDTGAAIAIMHYVDGLSQVEVAATLGITRRTVFNRLRKLESLAAELLRPPAGRGEETK